MAEETLGSLNLTFDDGSPDGETALADFIKHVANNQEMLKWKAIIHTGGKAGESLYTHIINLWTIIEQLRQPFMLTGDEMCCLLLALAIHDLNKVPEYGWREGGKALSYANAATIQNIEKVLDALNIGLFFSRWREYLNDIFYLAHSHQEGTETAVAHDQRLIDRCKLDRWRLTGTLKELMKAADVSDNSHSGNYTERHEKHIRDKLLGHINAALEQEGLPLDYRFVGHRLAELRGLFTNTIHNVMVAYIRERFQGAGGENACIDLLRHPEGVDYLLDKAIPFSWSRQDTQEVARRVGKKLADMQSKQLAQFIKAKPSGIAVDAAAMESGATLEDIFTAIQHTVENKHYRAKWRAERNNLVRADLENALADEKASNEQKEQITLLLRETELVPVGDEELRRGEFLAAYRNFLKDHRSEQLKAVKETNWQRAARLFQVPDDLFKLSLFVDPYRRGYFLARAQDDISPEAMKEAALNDLQRLEQQAAQTQTGRGRKAKKQQPSTVAEEGEGGAITMLLDHTSLVDYLERNLEVWDSVTNRNAAPTHERSLTLIDFGASLRRYADTKHPHTQCCYCGSALPGEEWMALQVPSSIGVQSFSNRLDGGSARDPKRNVCSICRMQFILDKLTWQSHHDKQGNELATFYLHCFPYSFFTHPLLYAWWKSLEAVRDGEHKAMFLDTQHYLLNDHFNRGLPVGYYKSFNCGVGIPAHSEAISNTPVMPLIIPGDNYGQQFLIALEMATLMAHWFDSRVLLSRMPIPSLNLSNERIGDATVALQVETPPRTMSWLLPATALTREQVGKLYEKLRLVYQLVDALGLLTDEKSAQIIYRLVAAADEPLALYHEVDRLIEMQMAQQKKKKKLPPEYQALMLSQRAAPYLEKMQALQEIKK
jgi:CRISPR-associated protein Csc3